jgi:hypothetical protein
MTVRAYTFVNIDTYGDNGHSITWTGLLNGDSGTPLEMIGSADRSVQVISAAFGAGGTVLIEGSNDGVNYSTLHDPGGNVLSFTSAGIQAVLEISAFIRPRVSAGDGTTSIAVVLLVRRP